MTDSEQDQRETSAIRFVAALGAAMASANYPVTMVGETRAGDFPPARHRADGVAGAARLWLLVAVSLGFMGVTRLLGTHSTAVFSATPISMMSIAVGVPTGLLLWRAAIQLTAAPHRRALHD